MRDALSLDLEMAPSTLKVGIPIAATFDAGKLMADQKWRGQLSAE
jgi:hypothetical protein